MNTLAEMLKPQLVGRTIVDVLSLSKQEVDDMMWYCDPAETVVVKFSDGTGALIMSDAEGNDAGWVEMVTFEVVK